MLNKGGWRFWEEEEDEEKKSRTRRTPSTTSDWGVAYYKGWQEQLSPKLENPRHGRPRSWESPEAIPWCFGRSDEDKELEKTLRLFNTAPRVRTWAGRRRWWAKARSQVACDKSRRQGFRPRETGASWKKRKTKSSAGDTVCPGCRWSRECCASGWQSRAWKSMKTGVHKLS